MEPERLIPEDYIPTRKTLDRFFDLHKALKEFDGQFPYDEKDDRAIVILGGTFLEMVLEHILYAFFPDDEKAVEKMMEYNQPLGNFSNKITMTYCLGLIEKVVRDDLNLVRKIRNKFAHDLYASFDDEQVKNWCMELKWHKILLMRNPPPCATNRDLFQVGVHTLISHLHGCISIALHAKRKTINNYNK